MLGACGDQKPATPAPDAAKAQADAAAKAAADAKVKDANPPNDEPGNPHPGTGNLEKTEPPKSSTPLKGDEGDPKHRRILTELQLRKMRELLREHPEILNKEGLSPEAVKRWEEEQERQIAKYRQQEIEQANPGKEPVDKAGDPFANIGAKPYKPADAASGKDTTPGAGSPPPEFREMYYKKFPKAPPKP